MPEMARATAGREATAPRCFCPAYLSFAERTKGTTTPASFQRGSRPKRKGLQSHLVRDLMGSVALAPGQVVEWHGEEAFNNGGSDFCLTNAPTMRYPDPHVVNEIGTVRPLSLCVRRLAALALVAEVLS